MFDAGMTARSASRAYTSRRDGNSITRTATVAPVPSKIESIFPASAPSTTVSATAGVLAAPNPAAAAPEDPPVSLKVGDPAPPLQVGKWLKAGPINQLDKGKIYVIECWATWCGPCIAAMPHVTQLQAKYKDKNVVVIGA